MGRIVRVLRLNTILRALRWIFVVGPDSPDAYVDTEWESPPRAESPPEEPLQPAPPSRWDTLLTWPVRLLIVAGAWVIGCIWSRTPGGIQLGWELQYGLVIAADQSQRSSSAIAPLPG